MNKYGALLNTDMLMYSWDKETLFAMNRQAAAKKNTLYAESKLWPYRNTSTCFSRMYPCSQDL